MNFNNSFLFFFYLITSSLIVQKSEYWILVKDEDGVGYRIKSFNEDLAEEYLGVKDIEEVFGEKAQVGAYRYYKLEKIDYYEDLNPDDDNKTWGGWIIDVAMWDWNKFNKWRFYEKKPKTYDSLTILDDPVILGQSFKNMELLLPPYFVPDPVEDYLESIYWFYEFKVEDMIISHEFEEIKGKELKLIYEFASNGFLLNQKLLTDKTNKIIYEYCVDDEPFSFSFIFIILGIIVLSIVILEFVYITVKKLRTLKENLEKNKGDSVC